MSQFAGTGFGIGTPAIYPMAQNPWGFAPYIGAGFGGQTSTQQITQLLQIVPQQLQQVGNDSSLFVGQPTAKARHQVGERLQRLGRRRSPEVQEVQRWRVRVRVQDDKATRVYSLAQGAE